MRIPEPSSSCFSLALQFPLLDILVSGIPFEVLDFGPPILKQLRCDIETPNFASSNIARPIFVRVRWVERYFFANRESAQEFSGFKCPRLNKKK